jgi:hypothetical protein
VTLLAGQTELWFEVGLTAGLLFAVAGLVLLAVFLADFDGDAEDVADVQRFIAPTEEARPSVPAGLPLFDAEKAAAITPALVRFQAKKDEARRALWASRDGRPAIASTKPGRRGVVRVEAGSRQPSNQEAGPSRLKRHDRRNSAASATEQEELIAQDDRIDTRLARGVIGIRWPGRTSTFEA